MHRLSGLQTLLEASHLFPEDEELRRLASAESAYPTIAVRALDENGGEIGAQVYLRAIDPFTSAVGEKRLLGPTPLAPTPILPGYYRAVVVFDSGGFRELVCLPGPAFMELELVARRRADEAALESGMVLIPGGDYTFPEYEAPETLYQGKPVFLDAYWIDATEVSNSEYQRFLEATGRPAPRYRRFVDEVEEFLLLRGDHPIVGITWNDAVAYAEWSGKRLATAAEWHRAAGGLEGRSFPYSSDPSAPQRGNVLGPPTIPEAARSRGVDTWTSPHP